MNLLLIDDDAGLCRLLERRLTRLGHTVQAFQEPEAALTWLEDHTPDLMLVDLGLPGMGGQEFINAAHEQGCRAPYAVVSGLQDVDKAVQMMRAGALDYLLKDSTLADRLNGSIERIIRGLDHRRRMEAAECALRDQAERLRAILSTTAEAFVELDAGGTVLTANPAAERLFSAPPEGLKGCRSALIFPGADTPAALQRRMTARAPDNSWRARRLDGTVVPVELSLTEMGSAAQRTWAIFARDITERRRLEREILEAGEREKVRFGQDIHDGLGQQLAALEMLSRMLSGELRRAAPAQPARAPERLEEIAAAAHRALQDARRLAAGLAPHQLEDYGLAYALQALAEQVNKAAPPACELVRIGETRPDSAAVELQFYRIAQEAVSNAIRHAKARRITITLDTSGDRTLLRISDDGRGFDAAGTQSAGLGRRVMRHRADLVGARLEITSAPDAGTVITCVLDSSDPASAPSTGPRLLRSAS